MKQLRYIAALCAMMCVLPLMGQPVITFDMQRHDFGRIEEHAGHVTHSFAFENTGNDTLIINKVRSSCGCAVAEMPNDPIAPGEKGVIKVTFNPEGRPGAFSKAIYVYANTDPDRTILRIIGEVMRSSQVVIEDTPQYAYRIGDMAVNTLHVALSKVPKGRVDTAEMIVENVGVEPIAPQAINVPSHMHIECIPDTLVRSQQGILRITYDPDAIDDWGYRRDEFNIIGTTATDVVDSQATYNTITVSGVLQEDFDSYTEEQREAAPILVLGKSKVDFKVVKGTEKVTREVYIFNAGKTPLTLHKVRCDNNIVKLRLKKERIKPGQSTVLTIELDPMRAKSNTLLTDVYVVGNDPTAPTQSIRLTAEFK